MFSRFTRTMKSADLGAVMAAIGRSQAVIEFNLDGTILTANDNFLKALGYSVAEIAGRNHSIFVEQSVRDGPQYAELWAKLRRGEFASGQFKRIAKGGRQV